MGETKKMDIFLFSFNAVSSNVGLFLIGYYAFFSQNVLGLAALILGAIATVMRVFDGITDPIIGVVMDKLSTKWGRYRPVMVLGLILMAVPLILIFNTPEGWPVWLKYGYTTILYVIYILGYTFQTTTTRTAQTLITKDPKRRPLFAQFQSITTTVVLMFMPVLLTNVLAPMYAGENLAPEVWSWMSLIVVGVMSVSTFLAVLGIRKHDVEEKYNYIKNQKIGFKDIWNVIKGNRAMQMLVVAASTDKLAGLITNGVSIYLFANLLLNNKLSGVYSLISTPAIVIFSILIIEFSKKHGSRKIFLFSSFAVIAVSIAMYLIGATPDTTILFLVVFTFNRIFASSMTNMLNPMIADCADYEVVRSKKVIPGIVGTVFTFVDKTISAFGSLIVGAVLAIVGFGNIKIPTNTFMGDDFNNMIMLLLCVPPILGSIANVIALKFYPLSAEKMVEVQEEVRLMREEASK